MARLLVLATVILALVGSSMPSPLYGIYQERLHFAATILTVIYAAYSVGTVIALCVLGWLSDRLGDRRKVLLLGLLAVLLGAVVMATAHSVAVLLIGRLLAGLGTGAVAGPATAALVELDPLKDGKKAAITATVAITAGGTIGPIISGAALVLGAAPTLLPFAILAILAILAAIALIATTWPRGAAAPVMTSGKGGSLIALIREAGRPYLIACGGMALAWMVGGTFVGLGPTFAHRLIGIESKALAGLTVSVFQVMAGLAQLAARNVPSRRLLVWGSAAMAGSLCLCAISAALGSAPLFCLGTIVTGLSYGACFSGAAGLGNRSAPARGRATLVSLSYAAGYFGNFVPVIALGAIIDRFGLFDAMSCCAVAVMVLGSMLALACRKLPVR